MLEFLMIVVHTKFYNNTISRLGNISSFGLSMIRSGISLIRYDHKLFREFLMNVVHTMFYDNTISRLEFKMRQRDVI